MWIDRKDFWIKFWYISTYHLVGCFWKNINWKVIDQMSVGIMSFDKSLTSCHLTFCHLVSYWPTVICPMSFGIMSFDKSSTNCHLTNVIWHYVTLSNFRLKSIKTPTTQTSWSANEREDVLGELRDKASGLATSLNNSKWNLKSLSSSDNQGRVDGKITVLHGYKAGITLGRFVV